MIDNFSNTQVVRKNVIPTKGGVVAAQHRRAAEVGASVLENGGDAIDAAIATSFAIGVVEPWMSGPAAGGCMTIWRAGEAKAYAIDYGMLPDGARSRQIPAVGAGHASDLFPWAMKRRQPRAAPPRSRCPASLPAGPLHSASRMASWLNPLPLLDSLLVDGIPVC